jgi:hypothetical protein
MEGDLDALDLEKEEERNAKAGRPAQGCAAAGPEARSPGAGPRA